MVTIDLSPSEQTILRDVLETTISELGMEIAGTDSQDFREQLKLRREVLRKTLGALISDRPV